MQTFEFVFEYLGLLFAFGDWGLTLEIWSCLFFSLFVGLLRFNQLSLEIEWLCFRILKLLFCAVEVLGKRLDVLMTMDYFWKFQLCLSNFLFICQLVKVLHSNILVFFVSFIFSLMILLVAMRILYSWIPFLFPGCFHMVDGFMISYQLYIYRACLLALYWILWDLYYSGF